MIDMDGVGRDPRGFRVGGYGPVAHHPCAGRSTRPVLGQRRACPYEGRWPVGNQFFCWFHRQIELGLITTIDGRTPIASRVLTTEAPGPVDLAELVREWAP